MSFSYIFFNVPGPIWSKLSSYQLPLHTEVVQRFTYGTMEHKREKLQSTNILAGWWESLLCGLPSKKHWILNVHQHVVGHTRSFTSVHPSLQLHYRCLGSGQVCIWSHRFWVTYSWNPGDRAKHSEQATNACLVWFTRCDFCNLKVFFQQKASLLKENELCK